MTEEARHHLIAAPGAAFVPRELAARFAPETGAIPIDEALRLRYCGGWLWRDGEREFVQRLASLAREQGVECREVETAGGIEPVSPERVLAALLEDDHLVLETPDGPIELEATAVEALDLGVAGDGPGSRTARSKKSGRQSEELPIDFSFPRIREALRECGFDRPNLQVHLIGGSPRRTWRLEHGTRFPGLIAEAGPQALQTLLLFIDRLIETLPVTCVLPEVSRFWSEGTIEPILWHRIEERANRLSWLRTWLETISEDPTPTSETNSP